MFNGTERLGGKSPEPGNTEYEAGHHYAVATQSERDHIPIVPPSPTRLLARIGPLSGERLGLEVLVALLLGAPALLWSLFSRNAADPARERAAHRPADPPPPGETLSGAEPAREAQAQSAADPARSGGAPSVADPAHEAETHSERRAQRPSRSAAERGEDPVRSGVRMRRAVACGLGVWMLTGIVLFSHMVRLHPRYVEGFTPVVAAMLGIGVSWASSARGWARLVVLAGALAITVYYAERLLYGRPGAWWIALAGALGAIAVATLGRLGPFAARRGLAAWASATLCLLAVLAIPVRADLTAIHDHVTDAGYVGALPSEEQRLVSSYLRAHQHGARYEVAAESATQIGSLIVQDARPVLMLTTYDARVFTSVPKLEQLIAQGQVRYAFLNSFCTHTGASINPACSKPAKWVRAHGRDVSLKAGLSHHKLLYLLPGAHP